MKIQNPQHYTPYGWYLALIDDPHNYLHSDGIVRDSTSNLATGESSGYFSTKREAELVKELWEIRNGNTN